MSYIIWHCYLDQKNTLSRSCYLRGFLDTRCQISRNIMRVFCCLPCKTIKYRFWFMAWRAKNRMWVKSLDGLKFLHSSVPPHKIIWILLIGCKFCPPFSDWSEQPWPSFLVFIPFRMVFVWDIKFSANAHQLQPLQNLITKSFWFLLLYIWIPITRRSSKHFDKIHSTWQGKREIRWNDLLFEYRSGRQPTPVDIFLK